MTQHLFTGSDLRSVPRPGTRSTHIVGCDGSGKVVIDEPTIDRAVGASRRLGCPCSRETLSRAIRSGEMYLGLRWKREPRRSHAA